MATFSQIPGTLNLEFVRGDTVSVSIDFDENLTNYSVSASLISAASGAAISAISASVTSGVNGVVTVQMTSAETLALAAGTYLWELTWESPAGVVRKALSGHVAARER